MFRSNRHSDVFLITLLLLIIFYPTVSFSEELIGSPPGDVITGEEAKEFNLFQSFPNYEKAVFSELSLKQAALKIYFTGEGQNQYKEIVFPRDILSAINFLLLQKSSEKSSESEQLSLVCDISTDEMSVQGELVRWTGDGLEIKIEFAQFIIPLENISSFNFKDLKSYKKKFGFYEDPNKTRLFFAPTGRTLKAGEGYFSVYEVVFPDVNYAILDGVSIGGGISPFSSEEFQMFWFTPKVGLYESDNLAVSSGILHFQIHDNTQSDEPMPDEEVQDNEDENLESFGIIYGVTTYGTKDYSATLGIGYSYGKEVTDRPTIMIGGEYRLTSRTKLITENWLLPFSDKPLSLLGIRWFGKKMAVDFALGRVAGMEIIAIPWVDFVINF